MKNHDRSEKEQGKRFGTSALMALASLLGASLGTLAAASTSTLDANGKEPIDQKAIEAGNSDKNAVVAIELHSVTSPPHVEVRTPHVKTTPTTPTPPTVKTDKGNIPNLYIDKVSPNRAK